MLNLGAVRAGEQIMLPFHTVDATGAPAAISNWPSGSPAPTVVLRAFGGTDMVAAGDAQTFAIDDLVDTGAYCVNGYAPIKAGLYAVIITGAVVAGVTCNAVVGTFQVGRADGRVTNNISGFSAVTQSTFTLPDVDMGFDVVGGVPTAQKLRQLVRSGHVIKLLTGAAKGELATISGYDPTTGVGSFTPALTGLPVVGDSYSIFEAPKPAPLAETDFATDALSARVVAADAATEIATAVGAFSIPDGSLTEAKFGTGALSARVLADGAITASKIAAAALTAAKLAADAITAIQAGLATASGLTPLAKTTDLATLATAAALSAVGLDVDAVQAALAAVQADTDNLQTRLPAALVGGKMDATATVTGLDAATMDAIAGALLTYANGIEPGVNLKNALRVLLAVVTSKSVGQQGDTPVFKSFDVTAGEVVGSKTRLSGIMNASGDRITITLDFSD